MAVKEISENKDINKYLDLRFDNGDLLKLDQVIEKWGFKDYQSFFRFAVSILLVTDNKYLAIRVDGTEQAIKPSSDFMKP